MRIRFQLLLMGLLATTFSQSTLSQSKTQKQPPLRFVNYDDNVDLPLTSEELSKITEVYGSKTQSEVLNHPQRLKDIKHILRNRIEFRRIASAENRKECLLLSQVELFNSYVTSLKRDVVFDKDSFNPLKYCFNFYARGGEMYQVDNTDYFIIIKSQYQ